MTFLDVKIVGFNIKKPTSKATNSEKHAGAQKI